MTGFNLRILKNVMIQEFFFFFYQGPTVIFFHIFLLLNSALEWAGQLQRNIFWLIANIKTLKPAIILMKPVIKKILQPHHIEKIQNS